MRPPARRFSVINLWLLIALVFISSIASGQHAAAPIVRPPVAPVHIAPPPAYRPPVMQTTPTRPATAYEPIRAPMWPAPLRTSTGIGMGIARPPLRPIPPIRRQPPMIFIYSPRFVFGEPLWASSFCGWQNCNFFWPWLPGYAEVSSPGPVSVVSPPLEIPVYVYGDAREDTPQLLLTDGTILNVTDYWVTDGQLHYKIIEQAGQKPVEQTIPFGELDLQKTIDVNTARGFRFVLRNEPFEQYVHDHPDGPPPALISPAAKPNS